MLGTEIPVSKVTQTRGQEFHILEEKGVDLGRNYFDTWALSL